MRLLNGKKIWVIFALWFNWMKNSGNYGATFGVFASPPEKSSNDKSRDQGEPRLFKVSLRDTTKYFVKLGKSLVDNFAKNSWQEN